MNDGRQEGHEAHAVDHVIDAPCSITRGTGAARELLPNSIREQDRSHGPWTSPGRRLALVGHRFRAEDALSQR